MLKKIIIFFIFIVLFGFIYFNNLNAQENQPQEQTNALNGFSMMCLDASDWEKRIDENGLCGCGLDDYGKCSESDCHVDSELGCVKTCSETHAPEDGSTTFTLTNKQPNRFPAGSVVYPAIKISLNKNCFPGEEVDVQDYYTTTIPENDYKLYCENSEDVSCQEQINCLIGNLAHRLKYASNPSGVFYADSQGNIKIYGETTYKVRDHAHIFFYALYPPDITGSGESDTAITGQANSQQQGVLKFTRVSFEDVNTKQDCREITWDPYGRVFDSQSLEPIPDVKVRLLSSIFPNEVLAFATSGNPTTTSDDGVFNFVVKPGTYYLRLANIPTIYTFSSTPNLNQKYKQIYKKFVDSTSSIYIPDQPIDEIINTPEEIAKNRPDLEERDIALDPGLNPPLVYPIKHMELSQILEGDTIIYRGKATHPYPLLTIKDEYGNTYVNKKEFTDDQARYGFWALSLKANQLPINTALIPILYKNPKYFSTGNETTVIDKNTPRFEPILRTIEGYAKNGQGDILPNAQINVKLSSTRSIYSKTLADSSGYFFLNSIQLPPLPYYLEFIPQDTKTAIIKTTSSFVKDNEAYLKENKINLMIKNNNQSISSPSENNFNFVSKDQFKKNNLVNNQSIKNSLAKKYLYVGLIIVFLITAVSVSIYFFIKRNRI